MSERTERAASTIKGVIAPDAAASQEQGTVTAPLGSSENPSNAVFTVANFITLCRFILTVIFLVLFVQKDDSTRVPAIILYAIAACTDFLDGQVARRTQTVSWVGKTMDPLMDRFLLFTGVLGLTATEELPLWIPLFVIGRDLYLGGAAMVLRRYRSRPLDVIYIGKVATALLMSGFVLLLIAQPVMPALNLINLSFLPGLNGTPAPLGMFLVYAGIVCSTIAAVTYTVQGFQIRGEVLRQRALEGEGA